jgi:hypothetical protein
MGERRFVILRRAPEFRNVDGRCILPGDTIATTVLE